MMVKVHFMMVKVNFMKVEGGSFYEGRFLPMSTFGLSQELLLSVSKSNMADENLTVDLAAFGARRNFKYC